MEVVVLYFVCCNSMEFGAVIRRKPQVKAELLKRRPAVIRRKPEVKAEVLKFWRL